jgi:O-antigen/teichoic acid export membrane protein
MSTLVEPDAVVIEDIKRLAGRGASAMVTRQGVGIGINLLGTIALSRLLGPAVWGIFAIAQVVYITSREIFGRGIASYLIKQVAVPSPEDIRKTFALQHLAGFLFLAIITAVARPAATWYGHTELFPLIVASGLASYLFSWRGVSVALMERTFDYVHVGTIEVLEAAAFYLVATIVVLSGHIISGLAIAMVLRGLLPTVLAFLLMPVRPAFFSPVRSTFAVADFGFFMAASSLVNVALLSVPVIFVGKLAGTEALGLAQMAFALYGNFLFATAAVLRLGFSTYSRLVTFPGQLESSVNQHLEMLAVALVPAIVLFAGLGRIWTPLIFGTKWHGLSPLLLALAPGYLLASVFWGVLNPALLAAGRHRPLLLWLAGITTAYAALTWLLAPHYSAMGVAAAFSLSQILLLPPLFWIFRPTCVQLRHTITFRELFIGAVFLGVLAYAHGSAILAVIVIFMGWWYWRNRASLLEMRAALMDLW